MKYLNRNNQIIETTPENAATERMLSLTQLENCVRCLVENGGANLPPNGTVWDMYPRPVTGILIGQYILKDIDGVIFNIYYEDYGWRVQTIHGEQISSNSILNAA